MSFMVTPPGHRNGHSSEGGNVEQLLRAFYRAEMPDPWPSFEAPAEASTLLPFPAPRARRPLFARSRLALAASVALLIGGLWGLSGKFGNGPVEPTGNRVLINEATHTHPGTVSPVVPDVKSKGPFIVGGELQIIIEEPPTGPGR